MSNLTYEFYHQHPVNKVIHFVAIPLIALTTTNFLDELVKINMFNSRFSLVKWVTIVTYIYNYSRISTTTGFVMSYYFMILNQLSKKWKKNDRKWIRNSLIVFILSWVVQFLGHYIEGRRPALIDSISTAFFEAPLFSIKYLVDFD